MEKKLIVPQTKQIRARGNEACYSIEPLERGYGMTLGKALQRVLLSSLPGSAVIAIRMEGVRHEHQKIDHVLEDISELILNVKQICLRSFSDQAVSVQLDMRGMREVTAADITVSPLLEIVNPECHLPMIVVLCIAAIAPAASMLFNVPVMASQAGASVALVDCSRSCDGYPGRSCNPVPRKM